MQRTNKSDPEWKNIIENTPEKEFRNFILNYAKKHRGFQDELIINLSKSQEKINIGKYQKIIAHTFKSMSDRYGYVDYLDTYAALRPVYDLLDKADECLAKGKLHEAFSIAAAIAPECIDAIGYIDDSDGECGGAVNRVFSTADKILRVCNDTQLADTIFDWLLEQMQNKVFYDYGCGDELEPTFFHWANTPSRLNKAYQFIEGQLAKYSNSDDWSSKYRFKKYLKHKTGLLVKEGKQEDAEQLINDNLHLSDFREMKIKQALELNDFQAAIGHLTEGISQAEKDGSPGIVHQFKKQLLDIYKQQKDQDNIRKISKELFLENRSSIDYYRIYKGTFGAGEWPGECEGIIRLFSKDRKKNYWGYAFQSDLSNIFIEEKMWDRLFQEVKQADRIKITEKYSKYLKDHYPEELIILYNNSILKYAENTGRNIYVDIVGYLKNMAQFKGGKDKAQKLMKNLLEIYKNRPAMKDEFRKLKW